MVKAKKRKVKVRRLNTNLPYEFRERLWFVLQLREQEKEKDPYQHYYLDDDLPTQLIWKDAIVIR